MSSDNRIHTVPRSISASFKPTLSIVCYPGKVSKYGVEVLSSGSRSGDRRCRHGCTCWRHGSGSSFGLPIRFCPSLGCGAVGALLKFILNEGLARWQLATGTTLLEGWVERLGRWVQYYFLLSLLLLLFGYLLVDELLSLLS